MMDDYELINRLNIVKELIDLAEKYEELYFATPIWRLTKRRGYWEAWAFYLNRARELMDNLDIVEDNHERS